MIKRIPYPPQVKDHPLLEWIWKRVRQQDNNVILLVTGLPGSGKSLLALYLMWVIDRDSHNRPRAELKNIVFSSKQFINAVRRNKESGRVIIWEEPYVAGVAEGGANSRQFMSQANLQISTIFGTMRKNRHVIILTMPFSTAFDFQARNVVHATIQVLSNNGQNSYAKVYLHDMNPVFKKAYMKRLSYGRNGWPRKMRLLKCGLAPKSFVEAYKEKANWYKDKWAGEISTTIGVKIKKKDKREVVVFELLARKELYTKSVKGVLIWDYKKIANTFKISIPTARDYANYVEESPV